VDQGLDQIDDVRRCHSILAGYIGRLVSRLVAYFNSNACLGCKTHSAILGLDDESG